MQKNKKNMSWIAIKGIFIRILEMYFGWIRERYVESA
jgi:hypothetical protein